MKKYIRTHTKALFTPSNIQIAKELYSSTKSIKRVADHFGVGQQTVKNILQQNGVKVLTRKESMSYMYKDTDKLRKKTSKIIELYNTEHSIRKIAKQFNTNTTIIYDILRDNWCEFETTKDVQHQLVKYRDDIIRVFEETKSLTKTAKEFDASFANIRTFLINNNAYVKKVKSRCIITEEDIPQLTKLYHNDYKSFHDIGKIYKCSPPTVKRKFIEYNIFFRTKREFTLIKGHTYYLYTLPSGRIVRVQGYEPALLDYIFSNKIFDESDIEFKPPRFKYMQESKSHYYYPDFYIPKYHLIIEIKSTYVLKHRQGEENFNLKRQAVIDAGYNFCVVMDKAHDKFASYLNNIRDEKEKL